jgi:formate-dependent nitrite reductase membrane component NrfD
MLICPAIIAALAMAGMIYFVVSKRSSPVIRRAAIVALVLAVLSILVCAFFLMSEPMAVRGPVISPDSPPPPKVAEPFNLILLVVTVLILIFFLVLILAALRRERKTFE